MLRTWSLVSHGYPLSPGTHYSLGKPRREGAERLKVVLWGESEHPSVL